MPETIEIMQKQERCPKNTGILFLKVKMTYFLMEFQVQNSVSSMSGMNITLYILTRCLQIRCLWIGLRMGQFRSVILFWITEALNEAGISQIQNYPTLEIDRKGRDDWIIDTGIDYQNPIFEILTEPQGLRESGIRRSRRELLPRDLSTEQSIQRRRLTRRYKERILWKLFHPKMRTAMGHFL